MENKDNHLFAMGQYPFEDLFKHDLIPGKGNQIFYSGMPLMELKMITGAFTYNKHYVTGTGWFSCSFIFGDAIEVIVSINPETSVARVNRIKFYGIYTGTYQGIGIGITIEALLRVSDRISFDEEFILIGKYPYDFIVEIDNDRNTIYSLDDVKTNKITAIIIQI